MRLNLSDFKGLVTAPGAELRPATSLSVADNCVIPAPGLIAKRTGYSRAAQFLGGPIWTVRSEPILGNDVLAHYGNSSSPQSLSRGNGIGAWGAQDPVDGVAMTAGIGRWMQLASEGVRCYFTTREGVRRLDTTDDTVYYAGMPRGMAPDTYNMAGAGGGAYDVLTGTGGIVADGSNVAYRVTWHWKDNGGRELGGAPTGRLVVRNQAGTSGHSGGVARNIALRIRIPLMFGTAATALTPSFFYRVWRSRIVSTGIASDEMYLVQEAFVTSGDISAGYASFTDTTPDAFLIGQAPLHTNATDFGPGEENSLQGVVNADNPPPDSDCLAMWRDSMWYANGQHHRTQLVTLLAVGGSGLVANDTITINGTAYTAKAAPAGATEFKIETTLASTTMNLEATVRNLCEVVNRNIADGTRLYPVSLGTQIPGSFVAYAATHNGTGSTLSLASSRGAVFRPSLATTVSPAPESTINQLSFSKPSRPDAVAPINFFRIGSESEEILQLLPFRDRLLVFTERGLYQVTGNSHADFTITPFDASYRLLARETCVVCDDKAFAWCVEGLVEIDDGGVRVISQPIEPTVRAAVALATSDVVMWTAFAIPDRNNHRVMFWYPNDSNVASKLGCLGWFAWDTRTRAWTTGSLSDRMSSGATRGADGQVVLANWNSSSADAYLFNERVAGTSADYTDTRINGAGKAITLDVKFNFSAPEEARGQAHWQQLAISLQQEAAPRVVPTSLTTEWHVEGGGSAQASVTPTTGNPVVRVETPTTMRRSNRMALRITHANDVEYIGITGLSLDVGGQSRWAK